MTRSDHTGAPIHQWLSGPLDALAKRQIELLSHLPDVTRVVVLPDAHAGARLCNGCVIATRELIYPDAVGGDIGCGYTAVRIAGSPDWCEDSGLLHDVLRRLSHAIHTLRGKPGSQALAEASPDPELLSTPSLVSAARRDGRCQLGTLGRGNHFVEIQRGLRGDAWLMVHSGSRAMGQAIHADATRAAASDPGRTHSLSRETPEGMAYLRNAHWATRWASANRSQIIAKVHDVLRSCAGVGIERATLIDSPHNTISIENHSGHELLIHRKSAVRAAVGEPILIAGSAATFSVHAVGLGCDRSLHSSAHGAGRAYNRRDAAARFGPREITRQYGTVVFNKSLAPRLRDESPGSYRDLRAVLKSQRELARVTQRLEPVLSFKGV